MAQPGDKKLDDTLGCFDNTHELMDIHTTVQWNNLRLSQIIH